MKRNSNHWCLILMRLHFFYMMLLVVVILIEKLENCDLIHANLDSYISFFSRGYMLKPLHLQTFLKLEEYLASHFRRSNHSNSLSLP